MDPLKDFVSLERHAEIVRSIYREHRDESYMLEVITGRQEADGHRYSGERCVWCGVNYLDHIVLDNPQPCEGPPEGAWDDEWWPLDKVDALLREHRAEARADRLDVNEG